MFSKGFHKTADLSAHAALPIAAAVGALAGLGALAGHQTHVLKKVMYARQGEDYKPESFIDKHPKTTGALSLGWAPMISAGAHQKNLDKKNKKVQQVLDEHAVTAGLMGL